LENGGLSVSAILARHDSSNLSGTDSQALETAIVEQRARLDVAFRNRDRGILRLFELTEQLDTVAVAAT
jgi:hypothetical protein